MHRVSCVVCKEVHTAVPPAVERARACTDTTTRVHLTVQMLCSKKTNIENVLEEVVGDEETNYRSHVEFRHQGRVRDTGPLCFSF